MLRRERVVRLDGLEIVLRQLHLFGGLRQHFGEFVECRIHGAEPRLQLAHEIVDLLAQLRLREVDEDDVLAELVRLGLRFVAHDVERRRDDFALLPRQLPDGLLSAAAATAAHRLRLRRLVVLAERPDLHEVDVARGGLGAPGRVGVGGLGVVRHEVARLQPELLEIDRVARAHFGERLRSAEQRHRLGRRAVGRVEQLQLLDAVVVVRARLEEELLDRAGLRVAPRLAEADRRHLVVDDVDRVLRRRVDLFGVRTGQLDVVEALLLDRESAGQRAVGLRRQRQRAAVLQQNPSAGRLHRRRDVHEHVGAADRRDVAAAFDRARLQARVRREVVFEIELLDCRQVDDLERELRRQDAVRLDVVLRRFLEVEQHPLERSALGTGDERDALVLRAGRGAHHHARVFRTEADELRVNRLIRALRHFGVSGCDFNLVRARRFRAAIDRQQRRQAVPQIRRTERDDGSGEHGDADERGGMPAKRDFVR